MPLYKIVQLYTETGLQTGRKEWFFARNVKEVLQNLLYYRRLKNKRACTPGGKVTVLCNDGTTWVITPPKKKIKKRRRS